MVDDSLDTALPFGPTDQIDLDQTIDDELALSTVEGAEDFLQSNLSMFAEISTIVRHAGVLSVHLKGSLRTLYGCRLYSSAAIRLPGRLDEEPQLEGLHRSSHCGVVSALTRQEPARFRIGVKHSGLRKQLIGRVASDLGWINDPSDWDVNITIDRDHWIAQIGALYYSHRFGALNRRPWSTTPLVAETMIRMAKPQPGMRVHDPCCGTGTLLIAADANAADMLLSGTDHDPTTIAMARTNLRQQGVNADLIEANATPFPTADGTLDRVVANLPFGKQVGSHHDNQQLYPALLREIARTLTREGRAVLLTEDKRLLNDTVERTKGVKLVKARILRYHGATPTAWVIARTRR